MKITKRQLRQIIKEALDEQCSLDSAHDDHTVHGVGAPADHYSPEVPSAEDYDRVRDFLNQNEGIVDLGISMMMDLAGTHCERSTAQAIIDHLKGKVSDHGRSSHHDHGDKPMMVAMPMLQPHH